MNSGKIIGKINNIEIDDSLLNKIDLDCLRSKSEHYGSCSYNHDCCRYSTHLTPEDIERIQNLLPQIKPRLQYEKLKFITNFTRSIEGGLVLRLLDSEGETKSKCIFNEKGKCVLEDFNAVPIFCRSFPVIIYKNVLKLVKYPLIDFNSNLGCFKEEKIRAYILLEKEISLITSSIDPNFYKKLVLFAVEEEAFSYKEEIGEFHPKKLQTEFKP